MNSLKKSTAKSLKICQFLADQERVIVRTELRSQILRVRRANVADVLRRAKALARTEIEDVGRANTLMEREATEATVRDVRQIIRLAARRERREGAVDVSGVVAEVKTYWTQYEEAADTLSSFDRTWRTEYRKIERTLSQKEREQLRSDEIMLKGRLCRVVAAELEELRRLSSLADTLVRTQRRREQMIAHLAGWIDAWQRGEKRAAGKPQPRQSTQPELVDGFRKDAFAALRTA